MTAWFSVSKIRPIPDVGTSEKHTIQYDTSLYNYRGRMRIASAVSQQ